MQTTGVAAIGDPIPPTALAVFGMGGEGRSQVGLVVKQGGGGEPGKPGGTAHDGAGVGIVGVEATTDDGRGAPIFMSGHGYSSFASSTTPVSVGGGGRLPVRTGR